MSYDLHLTFFHFNNAMEMAQPHTVHKDYSDYSDSDYKQAERDIHLRYNRCSDRTFHKPIYHKNISET